MNGERVVGGRGALVEDGERGGGGGGGGGGEGGWLDEAKRTWGCCAG